MVKQEEKCFSYEIEREGAEANLVINTIGCPFYPSLEDNEIAMEKTVDLIIETGPITTITYQAERNYIYPFEQAKFINELAATYIYLIKEKEILKEDILGTWPNNCRKCFPSRVHPTRECSTELSLPLNNLGYFDLNRGWQQLGINLARLQQR